MVEIRKIYEPNLWNDLLHKTQNDSVFSTFEWGEYKKNTNWKVERLAFFKSGNFLGIVQLFYKIKFGVFVGWSNSGINYTNFSNLSLIIDTLKKYLSKYHFFYNRFSFFEHFEDLKYFEFNQVLFESKKYINSNFSIIHHLSSDFYTKFSSNHRYYFKQSCKNNLTFSETDLQSFIILHNEMTQAKQMPKITISLDKINLLKSAFGDNLKFFGIFQNSNLICGSAILFYKNKAYYYLAASNESGRKNYAAYFMIYNIFDFLVLKDIKEFDFMGITPFDNNAFGVNKFKLGFGGDVCYYSGEWEISNSNLLSFLINRIYL
ncbi:Uncharacterized protein involved in methicillin resistance [Campylobacter hyointestinalis]|uniref:lipid II:glycine glycyltransferase FemX n=2 Tax=Campylobacter hyointestinalis TaxID=198 RepID=UPI00072A06DF|nr:peptidoglycan bridge formation glycyltransferase FemA/FemB family protein [Campylobacter hyointestinalis]CUU68732.1 Uncharacterized protein involved in methicillin resistance [Campylobacter hyointestinalis]